MNILEIYRIIPEQLNISLREDNLMHEMAITRTSSFAKDI